MFKNPLSWRKVSDCRTSKMFFYVFLIFFSIDLSFIYNISLRYCGRLPPPKSLSLQADKISSRICQRLQKIVGNNVLTCSNLFAVIVSMWIFFWSVFVFIYLQRLDFWFVHFSLTYLIQNFKKVVYASIITRSIQ